MKKSYFIILLLSISANLFAQIPAGYYDSAVGSGYTLKSQLEDIINNTDENLATEYQAVDLGYSALYTTFETSDVDIYYDHSGPIPATNKVILDMYSELPSGTDSYEYIYGSSQQDNGTGGTSEGQKFNREHIVPQSTFDGDSPMKNDPHFVVPSDKYVNAQRASFPYGEVPSATNTYSNGSKKGLNSNTGYASGYSSTVFEPIDEFKGDIARMIFYFVTRYEAQLVNFSNLNGTYVMFDGSANQAISQPFLDILYNWHVQDPVSQREIDRNNAIFTRNNNRNPFIDNPTYVQAIWQAALSVEKQTPTIKDITIYPNPTSTNSISLNTSKNLDVNIYNVLGQKVLSTSVTAQKNNINIESLKSGVYIIKLKSNSGTITKKLIKR